MKIDIQEYQNFALSFVEKSGEILKEKFKKNYNVSSKNDGSFVTDIDKEIEKLFRLKINSLFPSHGIIGEEFDNKNINSNEIWVIDPLDGTHSFIAGKPLFGTLVCLIINKVPTLGIIDIPILNQRWHGGLSLGVYLNNKICKKVKDKPLSESIVSSTSFLMFNEVQLAKVKKVYSKSKFSTFGTDCFGYGLLLSGKIDLIVEANMKPWDYMAQIPLIKEQGGFISDWSGKPLNLNSNGEVIACRSESCYNEAMKFLSNERD